MNYDRIMASPHATHGIDNNLTGLQQNTKRANPYGYGALLLSGHHNQ